jgi:alpha-tubulin suppressor-like RCC1 family protein
MTTLTLGKIKFVNRGAWSSTATYTQGDVVQYNGQSYIYKNETSKSYTSLLFGPLSGFPMTGNISGMTFGTDTFTVTWDTTLPNIADSRIVANADLFAYASFLEPDCRIISITNISTTQSTIQVSKRNTLTTGSISGVVAIGPRRMANTYEVALNKTDWDLLSEGMTYSGEWSRTANYTDGQIVVRNGNSYFCTNGHTNVDPLFDYVGVWEPFLIGHDALPHERIVCGVNKNPFNWAGHPYVKKPTFSNATTIGATAMIAGTTYTIVTVGTSTFTSFGAAYNTVGTEFVATATGTGTGTVACTYSGIPWNIPASHKDPATNSLAAWAWAWNTPHMPAQMKYRGSLSVGADGRGHRIGKGHIYYGMGGPGQIDSYRLSAGEEAAQYFNDYYTDANPHFGNKSFAENFRKSQAPRLMQNNAQWSTNASLTSNGTVIVGGTSSGSSLGTGEDADYSSAYIQLDKSRFGNRSIVKLAGGNSNSRNSSVWYAALDEFGELWTWGYNGYGQCGIGPENHLSTGYRVANQTDNVRTPMCLPKAIFFENNRIVDVFTQENSIHVLDEAGQLWGWGRNNYGQLGFTTSGVMVSASQCAAPYKVPVTWSSYGGIQKVMTVSAENQEWIMVLDGQGHVWTMGYNDVGQLGTNNTTSDGNASGTLRRTSSTAGWSIGGGIKNIWATTGGCQLSFFLDTSLQLWACGNAGNYNFGSASTSSRLTPAQMFGPKGAMTDIVCVSGSGRSGANSQVCLDKDGITYGSGWNQYGEAGVGHQNVVGNNYTYHQQNGTSSTNAGWARCFMASNYYEPGNRVVDIWGYGDYDAPAGHVTANFWLTERGEILLCGRDYNYSINGQGEPQNTPHPVHNFV